jgi:hypothetical protein
MLKWRSLLSLTDCATRVRNKERLDPKIYCHAAMQKPVTYINCSPVQQCEFASRLSIQSKLVVGSQFV